MRELDIVLDGQDRLDVQLGQDLLSPLEVVLCVRRRDALAHPGRKLLYRLYLLGRHRSSLQPDAQAAAFPLQGL
ncbi:MAG: hypothetical protein P8129_21835, partial [Anaerolineae bacterium]